MRYGRRIKCDLCNATGKYDEMYNHLGVRICHPCASKHVGQIAKDQRKPVVKTKEQTIEEFFGG